MTCSGRMRPPWTWYATWDTSGRNRAAGCCGFARCAVKSWSSTLASWSRSSAFTRAGDEAFGAGRLPVCADGGAAVVPAGDAQALVGSGTVGATAGSGWHLAAGAERGPGGVGCAGGVPTRAVAALGAHADPGTPGQAHSDSASAGDGQRGTGDPGDRPASLAGD